MLRKVAKCHKILNTYIKMIYDFYGDAYDFNLDTTINAYPTCEEANEIFGKLYHTFGLKHVMGESAPPLYSMEDIEDRMRTEDFTSYAPLKPKEYKEYIPKERRMPYRMIGEYVDRKSKKVKSKVTRKPTKKIVKKCRCS
jgi:hypothetical protein